MTHLIIRTKSLQFIHELTVRYFGESSIHQLVTELNEAFKISKVNLVAHAESQEIMDQRERIEAFRKR